MKKILLSALTIATFSFGSNAQTFGWANISGSDDTDYVYGIASDNQGNTYNVGTYNAEANDFDPGTSTVVLPFAMVNGQTSGYIQKIDANGDLVWVKSLQTGTSKQVPLDVVVDANGDVIIAGLFKGTVDFDPGVGTFNITSIHAGNNEDGFILKLDANGGFVWAKQFAGGISGLKTRVQRIDVDAIGNIYAIGHFEGAIDLDPGAGTQVFGADYALEVFVVKLNTSGDYVWGHDIGAPLATPSNTLGVQANDIKVDNDGDVFVMFGHNATGVGSVLYSGDANNTNLSATAQNTLVILKIDNNGDYIYRKLFATATGGLANEMALDKNGNVYVTGWFKTQLRDYTSAIMIIPQLSGGATNNRNFIFSYSNDLQFRWAHGSTDDHDNYRNYSVATNSQGKVVVGGFLTADAIDVDPSSSTVNLNNPYTNNNYRMAHAIIYDTLGNFSDAFAIGCNSQFSQIQKIHIDNNDNIYLGGYIESGTNHLNPFGADTDIPTNGGRDAFVIKIGGFATGVNDVINGVENVLFLYPNPATSQLTIESGASKIENITILDVTGKTINSFTLKSNTIDVSNLVKGIYFLQVQTKEGLFNSKFIKE